LGAFKWLAENAITFKRVFSKKWDGNQLE